MASKPGVPQTGVNPNQAGVGPNKGNLKPGDVVWTKPPKGTPAGPAMGSRVNASSDDGPRATVKAKLAKLSPARRKKLAAALKRRKPTA